MWKISINIHKKHYNFIGIDLLPFCRSGNEEKLMALLTPLNVNCHASDGRKVSHLRCNIPLQWFFLLCSKNFWSWHICVCVYTYIYTYIYIWLHFTQSPGGPVQMQILGYSMTGCVSSFPFRSSGWTSHSSCTGSVLRYPDVSDRNALDYLSLQWFFPSS